MTTVTALTWTWDRVSTIADILIDIMTTFATPMTPPVHTSRDDHVAPVPILHRCSTGNSTAAMATRV